MKAIVGSLLRRFRIVRLDDSTHPKQYFDRIYRYNFWGGKSSRSGTGSEGEFARQKIAILDEIIKEHQVSSILDLGCGDFFWMQEIAGAVDRYHGVDIVESVIEANKRQFENEQVSFSCLDLSDPEQQKMLPVREVDLVTCLDVFGHMLNQEVDSLLNFVLNDLDARLLLVTNRRDESSTDYLQREKTRHQGIDIEQHPLFLERQPKRVKQVPGHYPDDFFDLYDLASK